MKQPRKARKTMEFIPLDATEAWKGIAVCAASMLLLVLVCFPLQARFGMWGLAATELCLLVLALVSAALLDYPLREVFPVKKPTARQLGGMALVYLGANLLGSALTMLSAYVFPSVYARLQDVSDMSAGAPFLVSFLVVAVLPGICEESLFRGVIQHAFSGLRNRWVTVVSVGLLFGLFHLDPPRFIPTALLGMAISYVMAQTGNILLPILYHFVNNLAAVVQSHIQPASSAAVAVPAMSVAVTLILAIGGVWLLYAAGRVFAGARETAQDLPDGLRDVQALAGMQSAQTPPYPAQPGVAADIPDAAAMSSESRSSGTGQPPVAGHSSTAGHPAAAQTPPAYSVSAPAMKKDCAVRVAVAVTLGLAVMAVGIMAYDIIHTGLPARDPVISIALTLTPDADAPAFTDDVFTVEQSGAYFISAGIDPAALPERVSIDFVLTTADGGEVIWAGRCAAAQPDGETAVAATALLDAGDYYMTVSYNASDGDYAQVSVWYKVT